MPDAKDAHDKSAAFLTDHLRRQQAANAGFNQAQRQKGIPRDRLLYLSPLLIAPALPIIRIAFRKNPVVRDRVFFGAIAVAGVHGFALMSGWWKRILDGDER